MKLQIRLKVKNHKLHFRGFSLAPSGDDFPPPFQTTLLPLGGQTPKNPSESRRTKEIADMFGYFVLSCLGIMVRSSTRGQIRAKSVKGRWQRANKSSERRQRESEG